MRTEAPAAQTGGQRADAALYEGKAAGGNRIVAVG